MSELPVVLQIKKIKQENANTKTIFFDYNLDSKPGQFIMIWVPGADEKPFAASLDNGKEFSFTFFVKGPFTRKLFELKEGDKLGVRGPYGRGFTLTDKKACLVGGGCGIGPLAPLAEKLNEPVIIIGARDKENVIFGDRFPKALITTDDGSLGRKGYATEILEELLKEKKIGMVYTCGPEMMMKKVVELCGKYNVECEASLERYMKCGFGVCGQCVCNDKLVCKDGPVFTKEELLKMDEFGSKARLKTGKKVGLKEYCG